MKHMLVALSALTIISCSKAPQADPPKGVGQAAPAFQLPDVNGQLVSLANFRGKPVVLEWNNPDCPFVGKHYESGNMQKTQAAATKDGVVWLTINSGAPGNQGHMTGGEAKAKSAELGGKQTAYLLDPDGKVGKAYDAKTTPQMYVINAAGILVYAGAIDDKPTSDQTDIATARNHVLAALQEIKSGKPVSVPTSKPYGCSVKYSDS